VTVIAGDVRGLPRRSAADRGIQVADMFGLSAQSFDFLRETIALD